MDAKIRLSEHVQRFLDRQIAEGRHVTASEALEEAVRRYEQDVAAEEARIASAIEEGMTALQRGDYTNFSTPGESSALWERISLRASKRAEEMRKAEGAPVGDRARGDSGSR